MADIIASVEKNQNQLMQDFKELIRETNESYKEEILSPLTITLGDEFQCILKDLEASVNIILNLEEAIIHKKLNFRLRYVLHQGNIETPINSTIAYEMLGSGLTEARHKLNNSKHNKFRYTISVENKLQHTILINAFKIFENITEKWDIEKDYEIVSNFIKFKDYKIVSEKMNKTRSQLWKREKTLNIESYNSIKNIIQLITLNQ
ncbi:SatD family protein [Flavobacterium sp. LB3P122]|uniref:SatD family protein n=1 Tax=Flavobacterium algoriphilum TaxID=3398738 RepID=UPI003A8AF2C3